MSEEIIININPSASDSIVIDATSPAPENIQVTPILSNVASVNGKTGVVVLDKNDIGLDQVDNTSDLNKPLSYSTLNYTHQYFLPLSGGTVVGNISSNDTIFAKSGNSNQWNSVYTNVQSNSAKWEINNLDGGSSLSVYLGYQTINGGTSNTF
jgi:hypothetical protein